MSLAESEYAAHRDRSRPFSCASAETALALAAPCSGSPDQATGVDAVDALGHRAECAGQAEPVGDDLRHLHRGRGDQPHLLPPLQVPHREGAGAGPDPAGHRLVVDLLADGGQLGDRVTGHPGQRLLADLVQVLEVLADRDEPGLLPGHRGDVAGAEEVPPPQPPGEDEDARAADDGVVHVEERGRGRVGRRRGGRGGERLRRCGARDHRGRTHRSDARVLHRASVVRGEPSFRRRTHLRPAPAACPPLRRWRACAVRRWPVPCAVRRPRIGACRRSSRTGPRSRTPRCGSP